MHKPILRRVGLVLLVASLLQIAWTITVAIDSHRFYFDFTVMAASIALLSGSLSAAHFIRRLAAFGVGASLCYAAFWIATEPLSLILARLRLQAPQTLTDIGSYVLTAALCTWSVRELSRPEIMADAPNHRLAWVTPRLAFAGGIGFCVLLGAALVPFAYGETGARAVRDANARLRPSFRYHLSGLGVEYGGGITHFSGTVVAWNDLAVVELPFAWDE